MLWIMYKWCQTYHYILATNNCEGNCNQVLVERVLEFNDGRCGNNVVFWDLVGVITTPEELAGFRGGGAELLWDVAIGECNCCSELLGSTIMTSD